MKSRTCLIACTLLWVTSGCQHRNFPLCPVLARTKPSPGSDSAYYQNVGASLYNACKKHHIRITVLSENIAEFSGSRRNMKWLQANYHILLCDFDELNNLNAQEVYTKCTTNVQAWIKIVQSGKTDELMTSPSKYCIKCLPKGNCTF